MKKLILLILIGANLIGCSQKPKWEPRGTYNSGIELQNLELTQVIIEYRKSQTDYFGSPPKLIQLDRSRDGKENIYRITTAYDFYSLINPNIFCITRMGDCYVAYRDMTNTDMGMELYTIADILKDDFPQAYEAYLRYYEKMAEGDADAEYALLQFINDSEVWEARFLGDSLISKTVVYP